MRRLRYLVVVTAVAMTLGSAVQARADPIVVTSPSVSFFTSSLAYVGLSGDRGFSLASLTGSSGGVFAPGTQCFTGCAAGTSVSLHSELSGNDLPAAATLDGNVYTNVGSLASLNSAQVRFLGTAVLPAVVGAFGVVSTPFTFTGLFIHDDGAGQITETLVGHGQATVFLTALPGATPSWLVSGVGFVFDPASTVPEPASMLLVGSGLAAVLVRRRQRARS